MFKSWRVSCICCGILVLYTAVLVPIAPVGLVEICNGPLTPQPWNVSFCCATDYIDFPEESIHCNWRLDTDRLVGLPNESDAATVSVLVGRRSCEWTYEMIHTSPFVGTILPHSGWGKWVSHNGELSSAGN